MTGIEAGTPELLSAFGVGPASLLGSGGEADVYALGSGRVLRVHRPGARRSDVEARAALLEELARTADRVTFEIPKVLELAEVAGRMVSIEPRRPGRALMEVLRDVGGSERESLLTDYMECASAIGDLELVRDFHGELRGSGAIQLPQFRDWLAQRAAWCLQRSDMPEAEAVDPVALTEAWPEPAAPALVHFDVFPGNLLADAGRITSVLDFGTLTISGDRRLDPLNAAVYLEPAFSPSARASDRALAHQWLETKGLGPLYALTRRWLAVFWSATVGEQRLRSWSRDVLREPWPPTAPDAS